MQFRKISLSVIGALGLIAGPLFAQTAPAPTPAAPVPTQPQVSMQSATSAAQHLPDDRVKATLAAYKDWLEKLDQRHAVAGGVVRVDQRSASDSSVALVSSQRLGSWAVGVMLSAACVMPPSVMPSAVIALGAVMLGWSA